MQARENLAAIQRFQSKSQPPLMQTSGLGLSGHGKSDGRAHDPTRGSPYYSIPRTVVNPFPEEFKDVNSLKFLKLILNSANKTPDSKSNSNFTVQIDKSVLSNINVGMISLSDLTFPLSQWTIESAWSRLDYNEGIVPNSFLRTARVIYPDEDPDYFHTKTGILPLTFNIIENIIAEDEANHIYRLRTGCPYGSNIETMQDIWQDEMAVLANRFTSQGVQLLGKNSVKRVSNVKESLHTPPPSSESLNETISREFRVQFNEALVMEDISEECVETAHGGWGYLVVTPFASPQHLAEATTKLLNSAPTFRAHKHSNFVETSSTIMEFTFGFTWDPVRDLFYLTYSAPFAPEFADEYPILEGDVLKYMGFNVPLRLEPFGEGERSRSIAANGTRQTNQSSGTRVLPGIYTNGFDLADAMETSLNSTWWGREGDLFNRSTTLSPFQISVSDIAANTLKVIYCPGRYTPHEIANLFNLQAEEEGSEIRMAPVFRNGIEFVGMKFDSKLSRASNLKHKLSLPFSLLFELDSSGDPWKSLTTIDPRRLGYNRILYTGKDAYFPVTQVPYYPTIFQGTELVSVPSSQHYRVAYDERLRRMSILAEAFSPAIGCISQIDTHCRTIKITLPLAHGAVPGARIFITPLAIQQNGGFKLVLCPEISACTTEGATLREDTYAGLNTGTQESLANSEDAISCIVLPTETIDDAEWVYNGYSQGPFITGCTLGFLGSLGIEQPNVLYLSYGGNGEESSKIKERLVVGQEVYVTFQAPNIWSLNCAYNVEDCIQRGVVGLDAAYYVLNQNYPNIFTSNAAGSLYVFGTDGITNPGVPKNAVILSDDLSFPSVSAGVVYSDATVFAFPHSINLRPFRYVFLCVSFNYTEGDGKTIGLQTTKDISANELPGPQRPLVTPRDAFGLQNKLATGPQINALARVLTGHRWSDGVLDLHDRLFEEQHIGVSKISSIQIRFINPDGTDYYTHGRDVSVGLMLSTVEEQFVTTQ